MELFAKLFDSLLVFVYHCFDRVVIHGYLSGLSRREQVVYFFRDVVGVPVVDPIEWAQKGVRKEDYVRPWLRRMEQAARYGVYFVFQSMEQGPTFRCSVPKFPTQDPNHRILAPQRSRYTHYYFYLRDETLGPMVLRVASFFPFQTTYYLNGHSFIEQELNREKVGFRKNDNPTGSGAGGVPHAHGARGGAAYALEVVASISLTVYSSASPWAFVPGAMLLKRRSASRASWC